MIKPMRKMRKIKFGDTAYLPTDIEPFIDFYYDMIARYNLHLGWSMIYD